jgi:parallel beta helix pectate lyase-like protein
MRYPLFLLLVLPLFFTAHANAADANGYTARYECRAGGPNCNVDVAALAAQACQQTITPSTPWSSINWNNNVICIQAGDHTSKGTLTLQSSGSASQRKVLRYYRAGDNDDSPWNQGANQAKIQDITIDSTSYWIVHRLATVGTGGYEHIKLRDGSSNNIINRVLSENSRVQGLLITNNSNNNTFQNSVIRNSQKIYGVSVYGISIGESSDAHVVNSEVYDIAGHLLQFYQTSIPSPGAVLENNDFYTNSSMRTDCNGNYTTSGNCVVAEPSVSIKTDGTQAKPIQIIKNRFWGARRTDTTLCCDGGGEDGGLVNVVAGAQSADWIAIKENVLLDAQSGISYYPSGSTRTSVIGNVVSKIKRYHSSFGTGAIAMGYADRAEMYLNTIVDSDIWTSLSGSNGDIRCNVVINSGAASGSLGSGTQVDYNAFYQTPASYSQSSSNTISMSTTADARSGDFCFQRKLQTGAETMCIANAKPTSVSPHYRACDATLGSRSSIGLNDDRL